jgi:hypothetical protein
MYMSVSADKINQLAVDKRRGPGRIAVVEVAGGRVSQRPPFGPIVIETTKRIDAIGRIAIGDDDCLTRRRHAPQDAA